VTVTVDRMIQGHLAPWASVRFSVRNTDALPLRLADEQHPLVARERRQIPLQHVVFPLALRERHQVHALLGGEPFQRRREGPALRREHRRRRHPSWVVRDQTNPAPVRSDGTPAFRNIRSMHSSSNVTCLSRTSATDWRTLALKLLKHAAHGAIDPKRVYHLGA
jgi:hypothetical protein